MAFIPHSGIGNVIKEKSIASVPGWDGLSADDVQVKQLGGALTNVVFLVTVSESTAIEQFLDITKAIFCVYGPSGPLFDRKTEELMSVSLGESRAAPKIYATFPTSKYFPNGGARILEFFSGDSLPDSSRMPPMAILIGASVARFHAYANGPALILNAARIASGTPPIANPASPPSPCHSLQRGLSGALLSGPCPLGTVESSVATPPPAIRSDRPHTEAPHRSATACLESPSCTHGSDPAAVAAAVLSSAAAANAGGATPYGPCAILERLRTWSTYAATQLVSNWSQELCDAAQCPSIGEARALAALYADAAEFLRGAEHDADPDSVGVPLTLTPPASGRAGLGRSPGGDTSGGAMQHPSVSSARSHMLPPASFCCAPLMAGRVGVPRGLVKAIRTVVAYPGSLGGVRRVHANATQRIVFADRSDAHASPPSRRVLSTASAGGSGVAAGVSPALHRDSSAMDGAEASPRPLPPGLATAASTAGDDTATVRQRLAMALVRLAHLSTAVTRGLFSTATTHAAHQMMWSVMSTDGDAGSAAHDVRDVAALSLTLAASPSLAVCLSGLGGLSPQASATAITPLPTPHVTPPAAHPVDATRKAVPSLDAGGSFASPTHAGPTPYRGVLRGALCAEQIVISHGDVALGNILISFLPRDSNNNPGSPTQTCPRRGPPATPPSAADGDEGKAAPPSAAGEAEGADRESQMRAILAVLERTDRPPDAELVARLIDFEYSGRAWGAWDLATMLGEWPLVYGAQYSNVTPSLMLNNAQMDAMSAAYLRTLDRRLLKLARNGTVTHEAFAALREDTQTAQPAAGAAVAPAAAAGAKAAGVVGTHGGGGVGDATAPNAAAVEAAAATLSAAGLPVDDADAARAFSAYCVVMSSVSSLLWGFWGIVLHMERLAAAAAPEPPVSPPIDPFPHHNVATSSHPAAGAASPDSPIRVASSTLSGSVAAHLGSYQNPSAESPSAGPRTSNTASFNVAHADSGLHQSIQSSCRDALSPLPGHAHRISTILTSPRTPSPATGERPPTFHYAAFAAQRFAMFRDTFLPAVTRLEEVMGSIDVRYPDDLLADVVASSILAHDVVQLIAASLL